MKKLIITLAMALTLVLFNQNLMALSPISVSIISDTNGVLLAPTNLFSTNITLLTNALRAAGFTSGISVFPLTSNVDGGTHSITNLNSIQATSLIGNASTASALSTTNSSTIFQHTAWVNTNIYTGIGTISAANGGHIWTISGSTFTGLEFGNYLVITNRQYSIGWVSNSTLFTLDAAQIAYTNAAWGYYSNLSTVFDSTTRQTAAQDNGGGLWMMGNEGNNVGYLNYGYNTNWWRFQSGSSIAPLGESLIIGYMGNGNNNSSQLVISSWSPFESLEILSNNLGAVSVRGFLTNRFGPLVLGGQLQLPSGAGNGLVAASDSAGDLIWTNVAAVIPTNSSIGLQFQTWGNTNIYPGTGTISASIGHHNITNTGGTFTGLQPGNYIIDNNGHQYSISKIISSSVAFAPLEPAVNITNSVWFYYSNYVTIQDSTTRPVGAIDGGAGFWTSGEDINNSGAWWFGLGDTNVWTLQTGTYGNYGDSFSFSFANPLTFHATPVIFSGLAMHDSLVLLSNGVTSINGISNVLAATEPFYIPASFPSIIVTNAAAVQTGQISNLLAGSGEVTNNFVVLGSIQTPTNNPGATNVTTWTDVSNLVAHGLSSSTNFPNLFITNTATINNLNATNITTPTGNLSATNVATDTDVTNIANSIPIPAANLTGSGTLLDAVLSTNIPRLNQSNTWSGIFNLTGGLVLSSLTSNRNPIVVGSPSGPVLTNAAAAGADGYFWMSSNAVAGGGIWEPAAGTISGVLSNLSNETGGTTNSGQFNLNQVNLKNVVISNGITYLGPPTNSIVWIGNGGVVTNGALLAGNGMILTTNNNSITISSNGTYSGTVTSVGLSLPPFLSVSGPITSSGTIAVTGNGITATFDSLQITNNTAANSLKITNTATIQTGQISNLLAGNITTTNQVTAASLFISANSSLDNGSITTDGSGDIHSFGTQGFIGGLTDPNLATNRVMVTIATAQGIIVSNLAAGTDGQYLMRSNAVAGGSTWQTITSGSGTVTSVTFTGDGIIDSSTPSSAVTTSGTLPAAVIPQNANTVLAGPPSGGATAPSFQTAPTISAANMTSIPAANLMGSHTTPDSVLSTNVPLQNIANIFGPTQTFTAGIIDGGPTTNLPVTLGSAGVLTNVPAGTNGNFVIADSSKLGGTKFVADVNLTPAFIGSSITALNGSQVTSGTVAAARLPTATASALGVAQADGTTITASGGVFSAVTGTNVLNVLTNDSRALTFSNNTSVVGFGSIFATNLATVSTNNTAISAGFVGEKIEALLSIGVPYTLTSAQNTNIMSIVLTPGAWNVEAKINFAYSGASITGMVGGISTTSVTMPNDGTESYSGLTGVTITGNNAITMEAKEVLVPSGSTVTVYLVAKATFSTGSMQGFGHIIATRKG